MFEGKKRTVFSCPHKKKRKNFTISILFYQVTICVREGKVNMLAWFD